MPLRSMTGFARASAAMPGATVAVDIKSVNARGLDVRLRLPPGYDAFEPEMRLRIGKALTRGAVTLTLMVERDGEGGRVVVNRQALAAVLETMRMLAAEIDARAPSLDGILGLKGVLEQHETGLTPEAEEAIREAILGAVDRALADLERGRQAEGERLAAVLNGHIDEIERLRALAEANPGRNREAILMRLRQQVAELVAAGPGLSEDRLAQEALLLATKADIREELDRLAAHVAAARELIATGGAVGRKLDFLSQEFNREANTLCAKSNTTELTAIGLDLKAVIDQLREQVQNIE
jgi:uncharacterized protein (TIGR00255 family)